MIQEIYLLRITWNKALNNQGEDIRDLFHKRLTEVNSESKKIMDPKYIPDKQFIGMLNYILNKLDDASIIEETRRIGKKYAAWITRDEHYHRIREALFWSLQKKLGDAWTTEINSTWVWFFTLLRTMMRS